MSNKSNSSSERFTGQVAVITGGATGLGRAIAHQLGREGARIALLDRDGEHLDNTVAEMRSAGLAAHGYPTDISNEESVKRAIEGVQAEIGPPQIMVNSAGISGATHTKILDYPAKEFDRIYQVNLRGAFLMTKYVLPSMLAENYGRILLIASIAGKEGNPGMCGYSATKSGVIGLVKGVAKEYAETGVTINGLAPAVIMTDMVRGVAPEQVDYMVARIPMKRCGTLEEVASMSSWIVSRECSFSTGFIFDLSGGRATY